MSITRLGWADDALCQEIGLELFFDDHSGAHNAAAAKQVCQSCPVRAECLAWALSWPRDLDEYGVFGGMSPRERRGLRPAREEVAA